MLKQRREAVAAVSAAFLPFEQVMQQAAILGPRCVSAMIEERGKAKLPLNYGDPAIALVKSAGDKALEALADLVAAHEMLATMPEDIGIRNFLFGDDECVPNGPRANLRPALAAVA